MPAHHNAPEKILIRRLCVSLLTRDGFLVISVGFLEVPVGLVYPHWLAQNIIYTVENCFGIVSAPCTVAPLPFQYFSFYFIRTQCY